MLPMIGRSMSMFMSGASATVPTIAAMPPIMLITPFASDRYSPGMVSGMSATTGPRAACFTAFRRKSTVISAARPAPAANGMAPKKTAESGSVTRMYGMRRPILVRVRSERWEKTGIRKSAKMLSIVMMNPTSPLRCRSPRAARRSSRKIGTKLSYNGSMRPMVKKPSPINTVMVEYFAKPSFLLMCPPVTAVAAYWPRSYRVSGQKAMRCRRG